MLNNEDDTSKFNDPNATVQMPSLIEIKGNWGDTLVWAHNGDFKYIFCAKWKTLHHVPMLPRDIISNVQIKQSKCSNFIYVFGFHWNSHMGSWTVWMSALKQKHAR